MEKKYIEECNLGEILEHLAERAVKNGHKVATEIIMRKFCGEMTLDVTMRSMESYKTLAKESYVIISKTMNDYDVSEDVFDVGLEAFEKEAEAIRATEEQKKESESSNN